MRTAVLSGGAVGRAMAFGLGFLTAGGAVFTSASGEGSRTAAGFSAGIVTSVCATSTLS